MDIQVTGFPVQDGAGRKGCAMGPDAYRAAGLIETLGALGHRVQDLGNLHPPRPANDNQAAAGLARLNAVRGWIDLIAAQAETALQASDMPVFLGGDHMMSAGTLAGAARAANSAGQPLFVLWLDAHPDLHTLTTTQSGNLHGTPLSYALGLPGFEDGYPPLGPALDPAQVMLMGLRSIDPAEQAVITDLGLEVHDMRRIDETGIRAPLAAFLDRVMAANARLHVSLDVDFLDPGIAPAVGTTVPGGATFREAHLVIEMLHDAGCVTSLDLAELNPFLDHTGMTARLMTDLTASLMGRRILDRRTGTL